MKDWSDAALAALVVLAVVWYAMPAQDDSEDGDQTAGLLDTALTFLDFSQFLEPDADPVTAQRNLRAFLDMIAVSEGTSGPNGYRTLVGGGLIDDLSRHPGVVVTIVSNGKTIKSTAAGRYQFLRATWASLVAQLGASQLPDFGPDSQDRGATELIRQYGALTDVFAGRFDAAVGKVRKVWASLPGAGYGQPENKIERLRTAYLNAGGTLA